jgi:hypothetical protein
MHDKTERRLTQLLRETEQCIPADELQLKQQRDTVEQRLRFGRDLEHAMTLLAKMETSHQVLLKESDRLRNKLAANGTAPDQGTNEREELNCQVIARDAVHDHETPTA